MLEKDQFKIRSLRFARSLQTVIKMANLFPVGHMNLVRPVQLSYDLLNALVKETRYLTLGFVDQRVLLNSILTTEPTVQPLENEFLKRGIAAVTFDAGITLAAYKNVVSVLAASPKALEDCGGLLPFMEQRPLEFARIFPASKNQVRNEEGDTLLEVGSEEYLISKAMAEQSPGFSQGIDTVLNRVEQMGGFGPGPAEREKRPRTGSMTDIQHAVDERFEALLQNPDEDPKKAYEQLAQLIRELRPDYVLATLKAPRNPGLATTLDESLAKESAPKEEVTAEVFEDAALRWAVQRLTTGPSGEDAIIVEEQVFRVLMRSLQATHTASRLAHRLAEFAVEYALPRQTYDRMQQEVRWISLSTQQKFRELMGKAHYTIAEFQRLVELMKELINRGKIDDALALGNHYFNIFEDYSAIRIEEIGRIPDLLGTLGGVSGEFRLAASGHLTEAVGSEKLNQVVHVQVVNALSVLAKTASLYEDLDVTHAIGVALEQSAARNSEAHRPCCTATLFNLLPVSAVDRICELLPEKRSDSNWIRMITALLSWSGASGVERLFAKLDSEPAAATRFVLIRLLARVGAAGLAPARQRLNNPEWYIARNACKILGELKDPDLLMQIGPALCHKDPRVQQAAMKVLMESRMPGSASTVAQALPAFALSVQEEALNELSFQSDPSCLLPLEAFFGVLEPGAKTLAKVIQAIAAIPGDEAANALARIAVHPKFDDRVHRAARQALGRRPGLYAQCLLLELDYPSPSDTSTKTKH